MKHRELTAEAGRLFDEGLGHKAVASRLCVPKGTVNLNLNLPHFR